MTADSDTQAATPTSAPSDNAAVSGILRHLGEQGFETSFVPGGEPGVLRCTSCDTETAIGHFEVHDERRMEGASDPDDMVMVVAAQCPSCGARGTIVLGFGPNASETDADLIVAMGPGTGSG